MASKRSVSKKMKISEPAEIKACPDSPDSETQRYDACEKEERFDNIYLLRSKHY